MISSVTPIIITIGFISIDVHCARTPTAETKGGKA